MVYSSIHRQLIHHSLYLGGPICTSLHLPPGLVSSKPLCSFSKSFENFELLIFLSFLLCRFEIDPSKFQLETQNPSNENQLLRPSFHEKKISIWKIRIACSCHCDGSGQSSPNKLKKCLFSFESLNGGGNRHIPWNGRRIYARLSNKSCPSWRLTSTGQLGKIFGNLGLGRFSPRSERSGAK